MASLASFIALRCGLFRGGKLQRAVTVINIEELMPAFEQRVEDRFLYGDFQYSIDDTSDGYLTKGLFSCYRPVASETPIPEKQRELSIDDWRHLILFAHANKPQAFEQYVAHYLATDGQIYWSDLHQLGYYEENYHRMLDHHLGAAAPRDGGYHRNLCAAPIPDAFHV